MNCDVSSTLQKWCILGSFHVFPFLLFIGMVIIGGREEPTFAMGMSRVEVYSLMGLPSNTDDEKVAFWVSGSSDRKVWRELNLSRAYIAVFDEHGRTLAPRLGLGALDLSKTMTDQEVVEQIKELLR